MKLHRSFRFLALSALGICLSVLAGSSLQAQIVYPTFTTGTKVTSFQIYYNSADTNETYSPAFASDATGTLWAAYSDNSNSGYLSVASSTDGVNFTVHQTDIPMDSATSWGSFQGNLYLAFSAGSPNIDIYKLDISTGSLTLQQEFSTGAIGVHARRPALAEFDNSTTGTDCFYLAWNGTVYDPGTGSNDGNWAQVATSCTSSVSFTTPAYNNPPVSTAYPDGTGIALTVYNDQLYLTYSDASTDYPQMFGVTSAPSTTFTDLTGPNGGNGVYGGDPATVSFAGNLYAMYRSAYADDELWAIGTDNGSTFAPSHEYGQTMKYSPSLTVTPSGVLYQSGFTDHPSSGSYMWLYSGD